MKTALKNVASFVATAVIANGEYDAHEQQQVNALAEILELDETAFVAEVEKALKDIEDLDGAALQSYIEKSGIEVAEDDVDTIYQIVVGITLVDGVFSSDEAENLLVMADALNIDHTHALMIIADSINDAKNLVVVFDEDEE